MSHNLASWILAGDAEKDITLNEVERNEEEMKSVIKFKFRFIFLKDNCLLELGTSCRDLRDCSRESKRRLRHFQVIREAQLLNSKDTARKIFILGSYHRDNLRPSFLY